MCYLTAGLLSTASSALTASSPSHLVPLKQAVVQNKGGGSLCLQHANISCRAAHKVAVGDGGCGVADEQVSGRVGLEADQRDMGRCAVASPAAECAGQDPPIASAVSTWQVQAVAVQCSEG